jgi:hypothetical protein
MYSWEWNNPNTNLNIEIKNKGSDWESKRRRADKFVLYENYELYKRDSMTVSLRKISSGTMKLMEQSNYALTSTNIL